MFEFKLSFYDEQRPYIKQTSTGQPEHGEFNKYMFLEMDDAGEWCYNTDFLFSADAGEGLPKDKMWLMNQTLMFIQSGLLNKVEFWKAMQGLGYPNAGEYREAAEQEMMMQQMMMQQQQQQAQQQQQISQEREDQKQQQDLQYKMSQDQQKQANQEYQNQLKLMDLMQKGGGNYG
jgi:hypothetical protein